MKKIILSFVLLALVFLVVGCTEKANDIENENLIGGDKDEFGCLIAAGYSWCPSTGKCQRMWEEYCEEYKEHFTIKNFDDCVSAGNPVMESYPRQCRDESGVLFVEEIEEIIEEFCGSSTEGLCEVKGDCIISGCSGQICQSINEEGGITTCEFRECYNPENYGLTCECYNKKCMWN